MKQIVKFLQVFILVLMWGGAQAEVTAYCTPVYSSGCSFGDGLTSFQLSPINQAIPCSGTPAYYHDYTGGTQATLMTGVAANLTMVAGYSSTYVTVWIDLNNDEVFQSGEIVVNGFNCAASGTPYTTTITVPTGSTLGTHRLRFRTNWLSATTEPCNSLSYGNAADFTVNVILPPPVGTLQGTIRNVFTNQPLAGVSVTVNAMTPVTSNAAGFYQKTNVPSGTCNINATLAGFQPYTGTAVITSGQTTTKDFNMNPIPSYLTGYVTNAGTNGPVHGAKIEVANTFAYSMPDGYYYFQAYPAGSQSVKVTKPGFDDNTTTVNITNGGTTTYNVALQVKAYPPGPVTATLNTAETAVDVVWSAPTGLYEIIYDDGGKENWTVWATAGNMNAVKFTPITAAVQVSAGRINIGDAANYAAGTDPTLLAPFQVAVYDATGPAGAPGSQIGDLIDVIPTNFGWNYFTFPTPITVTGNFYLVMVQGGTPPNAAGLAVDETTTKLRSYSKFGTGPWLPATGNYMIRAIVSGTGGPLDLDLLAPGKNEITANAIDGLIYDHTPASYTGVEGTATYMTFDWSTLDQVANMTRPSNVTRTTFVPGTEADVDNSGINLPAASYSAVVPNAPMATLFDNGPVFNSTGTGAGGANESIYYQGGTGTYGSGCQQASGVYVADDFVVPSGKTWAVTAMNFYSYQTNSTTTSTITGIYIRIWNGKPGVAGSSVVWGNMTTNRLSSTNFANVYRVLAANGGTARPVMNVVASTPGLSLTGGTYWVEWACTGSLASGPWAPPVVTANNVTGNAIQTVDAGVTYTDVLYNTYGQGFPFTISGTEIVPGGIPYTVWRLLEGQEGNEALWGAPIASNITATSVTDNSWPSLPCGAYRWAVKAGYPVNRLSAPTFSNVLGKCWTAEVTVNVSLTCSVTPIAGTIVKLQNTQFSQYVYTAMTTTTGTVTFPAVWKGTYDLTVSKVGYDPYLLPAQVIMGPMTFDVILLQQRIAPTNMFVDDKSLEASWNAPVGTSMLIDEQWASGNFTANGWTAQGNWLVRTTFGNPAPAAEFYWSPSITNYTRTLTSKTFTGTGSPDFKLYYDIYYSDWGGSLEEMAVEYQVGGAGPWILLKHYDNTGGDIPWTTETFDMSSVGAQNFQIRFRAYGVNSFNINNWDFDNIKIKSTAPDPKPCILAYNVYLNNVLDGVTLDTTYMIPPSHVAYGTTYNACVKAVYGSGYSAPSCYTFVSKFLYPPLNLQVEAVECVAYLTWEKPVTYKKAQANSPRATSSVMPRPSDGSVAGRAPIDRSAVTQPAGQQNNGPKGSIAFGYEAVGGDFCDFDLDNLPGLTYLNGPATPDFVNGMVYPEGEDNLAYASCYGFSNLYTIDHTTMAWSSVGNIGVSMGELTIDPSDGTLYGTDGTSLYSIDPAVPSSTLIGALGSVGTMIAIVCDGNGDMWGHDVAFSPPTYFYSVDKATGAATIVGDLGFLALYAQGALYDQATDQVILAAFNGSNLTAEIRAVDVTTGSSTILSSYYYNEISAACLPITGGVGPLKGLIGYKIYRDGAFLDDIMDPDTLFYYDFTVDPGTHEYGVTAYYDLTDYGFPGQFDESMIEGPVEVDIMCGRPLPFYEPWNSGNFTFNDWMLSDPTNTNWSVTPAAGNPEPCADFSWQPIQYTYELSIETPVLNGGPFTCATIWCDFDYKLADRNKTGVEKLMVDVFSKGQWKNKAELANNGDKNWTSMHVDISSVTGKAFKVRFRAMGENSADILHWYVDNVHVYAKCNPPLDLEVAAVEEKNVTLTWTKPECEQQASFNPVWIHWDDGTNYDAIGTGGAVEFDIAARWDASMITAFDGGQVTKIAFFPSSSGSASYKIRVWQGPDAATLLVDEAVASPTLDDWNIVDVASPVPIDISQELWIGVNVNASSGWPAGCDAGPEVEGYGNMIYWSGAWATLTSLNPSLTYNWNVQGYVEPADDHAKFNQGIALVHNTNYKSGGDLSASGVINQNAVQFNPVENGSPMDGREVLGYNVYMSDDDKVTYDKLNTNLVTDTTYNYTLVDYGDYYFYVTAVYPSYGTELCESDSSNVEWMPYHVGIDQQNGGRISVFPNPATENVFVKSDFTITNIEVMNYLGQTVYNRQNVGNKNEKVNVANYPAGIYFVKVTTTEGIRTVKITVAR